MMKFWINRVSICFLLIISGNLNAQDIIPLPQKMEATGTRFIINAKTIIQHEKALKAHAQLLAEYLSPATGYDYAIGELPGNADNAINLKLNKNLDTEEYQLSVSEHLITISGGSPAGVFYGFQTLRQLLPTEIYSETRVKNKDWQIAGVEMQDKPEYQWRGMMLDVSRYFFDKDYVMKYVDMMAMYKLNTLHLHLIDDAGWRLEIKKYPRLTSVGAWRGEGIDRVGGYYTQDDIREMVAYAAERNVDIVPEIEVPAHTLAAIAAYPYLSCTEKPVKVQEQHSISRELYCVGKESTFEFLENVLEEAFEIFPSKYIHIGGDEARYDRWKKCVHCQKRKKELGLKAEKDLQTYFNQRMQKIATKHGKTIVGWDEIIEEGLEEKAVGMVWHNKKKAFKATALGHEIVLALTDYCYLDFPESDLPGEVKAATWMPPISLEKAYHFDPVIDGLEDKYRPQILGGQGALWSDQFIHGTILQEIAPINENRSEAYMDYFTFPRMSALAEVLWTTKAKQSWDGFEDRMKSHYNRLDAAGYGYRVPQPKVLKKVEVEDGYQIELQNVVAGAEIRYTTNGIKPNVYSEIYTAPIKVNRLQDFQAITTVRRKHYSIPLQFSIDYPQFKKYGTQMADWRSIDVLPDQDSELVRKAGGKINKNGTYEITFLYTDGEDAIEIDGVKIYKNNRVFADDVRKTNIGHGSPAYTYLLKVDNYETGAVYSVKAKIKGLKGTDSNGVIFIKMKEEQNADM